MNFRYTAILIGAVLVVGVVLLVVTLTSEDNTPDTSTLTEELAALKSDKIDVVEIEREGAGRLKIVRTNAETQPGTWQIVEPYTASADGAAVEAAVRALMQAKPTIDPEPTSNLAARDLDPVGLKVTLRQGTDKSSTVNLGRVSAGASKGIVYVTTSARPNRPIAVPRSELDALFTKQAPGKASETAKWVADYRSKNVFPGDSRAHGEDIASLKLELPNKKKELALSRAQSGRWKFDSPAGWGDADAEGDLSAAPNTFTGVDPLVRTLTSLSAGSAADFIDNPGDLKQYGLNPDNPDRIRVEMKPKKGPAVIAYIGKTDAPPADPKAPVPPLPHAGGKVYVMVEGQPGVIRCSAPAQLAGLAAAINDPAPLRDRNLITLDRGHVDGVDIVLAGQPWDKPTKLRRVGLSWQLYGGPNDPQNALAAPAEHLVEAVTARRAIKDFPAPNPANFAAISATLFVWVDGFNPPKTPGAEPVKKSEPVKLEFGRREGDVVYVRRTLPTNPPQVNEFAVFATVKVGSGTETRDLLASVTKTRLDLLDPSLPTFGTDAVTKLTVTGTSGYTIEKDAKPGSAGDQMWHYVAPEPKGRVADAKAVEELLRLLGTTQSVTRFVDEAPAPEKLAEYGFAPAPRLKVAVTLPDGERAYEFGKDTADPAFVYARLAGKPAVFTLPRLVFDRIANPDLRDRLVFRNVPTDTATRVELRGWVGLLGKQPLKLVLEKNKDGAWVVPPAAPGVNAPQGFTAPDTAKVNALLKLISQTRAKTFETGGPAERHGFNEPAQFLEIKVWGPKGEFVWLNLGTSPDEGASEFVLTNAVPGPNPIITVEAAPFKPYKDKPTALEK